MIACLLVMVYGQSKVSPAAQEAVQSAKQVQASVRQLEKKLEKNGRLAQALPAEHKSLPSRFRKVSRQEEVKQ